MDPTLGIIALTGKFSSDAAVLTKKKNPIQQKKNQQRNKNKTKKSKLGDSS